MISQLAPRESRATVALSFPTVLALLLKNWKIILTATLASGLVLFCGSFLLRNTYKATSIVMPPDRSNNALSLLGAASSGGGGASASTGALAALAFKSPTDLYVAIMTSPGVEDSVIQQFHLQSLYRKKHFSQARKKFERNSEVKGDPKSGLITVTVFDHDPDRAAAMSNAIVAAYDRKSASLAITDAQRRRLFFEHQVAQTKDNLSHAEEALKNSSNKSGVVQPEGDARALIGYEEQLRAQIAIKTVQLDAMKVNLSDENPQVQTTQRELQGLQAQASSLGKNVPGDAAFASRNVQTDASLDYLRKLREVRYNETLYELLLKNLELAELDEAHEGNLMQVVYAATPPDMKDSPYRSLFLVGGLVLGCLASSIWVLSRWAFLNPLAGVPSDEL